jgi:ectoine hydroxylase-related dioxygenase (phytanoyl-CoA dioxygenase family)
MGTTDAQRATFHEQGLLHLPAAIATIDADRMAARIWDVLDARDGIRREDPATWAVRQPTGFQSLTRAGVFAPLASAAVRAALDDLLGRGSWQSPDAWGAPLVTFPDGARAWDVPSGQWHLDFVARESAEHLPGVRILGLLVDVQPRGGTTLIVGGSHRLVERLIADGRAAEGHSAHIRDELAAAYPWLGALWSRDAVPADRVQRFMTEGATIDGVQLRVIELTGAAGDVFLMHPWTLHAPAPNCGSTPRLMISQSVFRSPPSRG